MDVEELLRRVAEVYASCRSYRDRGEVTSFTVRNRPGLLRTSMSEFETAWLRPDCFRFEFTPRSEHPNRGRCVVWWSGGEIRSWWTLRNETKVFDELPKALAGPTGISHGTAKLVPELLFSDGIDRLVQQYRGTTLVVEELEGHRCFVLGGEGGIQVSPRRREWTWIDERTHLILRVDSETEFRREEMWLRHKARMRSVQSRSASSPAAARILKAMEGKPPKPVEDFRVVQTIRYWPELDPELGPESFEFEPPAAS